MATCIVQENIAVMLMMLIFVMHKILRIMDRVLASTQIWKDPSFTDMALFESNVLKNARQNSLSLLLLLLLFFNKTTTGFTIGERSTDWSSGTGSHSYSSRRPVLRLAQDPTPLHAGPSRCRTNSQPPHIWL